MTQSYIPYGRQWVDRDDIEAVAEVLRGDWLTTGPCVAQFEELFAARVGARFAVAFSNGTAALHGAMHAAGVEAGDCVAVPPLTFAATANAVLYCGGTPVFADIAPETLCLGAAEIGRIRLPFGGRLKAVAPVSYAGYPADIDAVRRAAEKQGALVIEDASHALGAVRDGKPVGAQADMTTFSFHPVKHITTAEGGMVATDSPEWAARLRRFRTHGIVKDAAEFGRACEGPWDNDMIELGYNYRLNEISCALGISQMKKLDAFVARRRAVAARYRDAFQDTEGVSLPPAHPGHAYHLFPIWVSPTVRKRVFETLRAEGIGVQVHYVPVHLHTYYRKRFGFGPGDFPQAETFSAGEISLPIFPGLSDEQVDFVAERVGRALA